MAFDRVALSAQVARIAQHAGIRFSWSAGATQVFFNASVEPWEIPTTEAQRNKGDHDHQGVRLTAAREVFGDKLPRQGQAFRDDTGRLYRIAQVPPQPAALPTVFFLCVSTSQA
jgi:hypothetical protein